MKNKKVARVLSSKLKNIQIVNSKRSFELAISTLVVIVLALLVLIALSLAFTSGYKKFYDAIKGYFGSESDNLIKLCQNQCVMEDKYAFCCGEKNLGKEKITCLDERVKADCSLECGGVC